MRIQQYLYKDGALKANSRNHLLCGTKPQLVLGFGAREVMQKSGIYQLLRQRHPDSEIVLCSSAGEIHDEEVMDDSVSIVVMELEQTSIRTLAIHTAHYASSFEAGKTLFQELQGEELCYVLVLSDGEKVNGSELVRGISSVNKHRVPVTGGLAGDGAHFTETVVGCNAEPASGVIAAIGFYGTKLHVGHGSLGGWDMFGPEKLVTRSSENRLYEIDGRSALELYKQYLGKYADELPGSALLFPLSVRRPNTADQVVRTILSIDNDQHCMVFAGDIPEGSYVRFMKANFDKLIDAATGAASKSVEQWRDSVPDLALLISCVGRKLILGKRVDEEVEAVREIFGPESFLSGFYSYGEISPLQPHASCELHNQTMTITTLTEII